MADWNPIQKSIGILMLPSEDNAQLAVPGRKLMGAIMPNYEKRYRCGQRISTSFIESRVNQHIDKRLSKSQRTRWSLTGALLLLQVRAEVVDGKLDAAFGRWYPGFAEENFTARVAA